MHPCASLLSPPCGKPPAQALRAGSCACVHVCCGRAFPVRHPARDARPSWTPEFTSPQPPVPSPGLFGDGHAGPAWGCPGQEQPEPGVSLPSSCSPIHRSLYIYHGIASALPSCPCAAASPRTPCAHPAFPAAPPGQAGAGTHPLPTPLSLAVSPLGMRNCLTSLPASTAPATEKPLAAALPPWGKQPPGSGTRAARGGKEGSGVPRKHCTACYMPKLRARRERSTQPWCRLLPGPPARSKAIREPARGSAGPRPQPLPCLATGESHGAGHSSSSPLAPPVLTSWPWLGSGSGSGSCCRGVRHAGSLGRGGGCGDCSVYYFLNTWLYLFHYFFFFYNASHW